MKVCVGYCSWSVVDYDVLYACAFLRRDSRVLGGILCCAACMGFFVYSLELGGLERFFLGDRECGRDGQMIF